MNRLGCVIINISWPFILVSDLWMLTSQQGTSPKPNELFCPRRQHLLKTPSKSGNNFSSYFANSQTNKHAGCHTTSSLGGGNKGLIRDKR